MNKFICIISFLVILESIKAKQTLLYYVTNEDQLNSIDKLNKISFLSNNNGKFFNLKKCNQIIIIL